MANEWSIIDDANANWHRLTASDGVIIEKDSRTKIAEELASGRTMMLEGLAKQFMSATGLTADKIELCEQRHGDCTSWFFREKKVGVNETYHGLTFDNGYVISIGEPLMKPLTPEQREELETACKESMDRVNISMIIPRPSIPLCQCEGVTHGDAHVFLLCNKCKGIVQCSKPAATISISMPSDYNMMAMTATATMSTPVTVPEPEEEDEGDDDSADTPIYEPTT